MSGNSPQTIEESGAPSTKPRLNSLWYAWAPESLARAQSEHKPIFLLLIHDSYWSRVAQRRFNRSSPLRDLITTAYVPILAHVEDHPEVNAFFAKFIKLSTGTVGWPMLLWLTPTGSPIMGSVYLPFEEKTPYFRVGLLGCLQVIARYWDDPRWRGSPLAASLAPEQPRRAKGSSQQVAASGWIARSSTSKHSQAEEK